MKARYRINGRIYMFEGLIKEGDQVRGYCRKFDKWANIYPGFIRFDGDKMIPAETISCPFWGV